MSTYTDASLIMFPSGYKEDKIYSLKPTDGSGDLTFTRASTATRVNSDGLIETSPVNLVTFSEEFDNAAWVKTDTTITPNSLANPINGLLTADKMNILSANSRVQQNFSLGAGTVTFSIYLYSTVSFTLRIVFSFDGTSIGRNITIPAGEWTRFSETLTASTLVSNVQVRGLSGGSTGDIFLWGAQLNIGATAKPYFPTTDRLNVPRIDYTGGGCGKLLLEPQRSNLATNSENWIGTGWIVENASVTANSVISPSGYQDADTLTGTGSFSRLRQSGFVLADNTDYTISSFLKAGTAYSVLLTFINKAGTDTFYRFNLQDGTAQSGAKIEDYGNGWYRCSFTANSGSGATTTSVRFASNDFGTTGGWTNGLTIHAWGAQLEAGSYVSSYIPTLASSVTRLADTAYKTGISSLIGQTSGTMFVDFEITNAGGNQAMIITSAAGNELNRLQIYFNSSLQVGAYRGDASVNFVSGAYSVGQRIKAAVRYKLNDYAFYVNGVQIGTDTSASIPLIPSVLYLGTYVDQVISNTIKINQSAIFAEFTNAQLATLTTI